MKFADRLKETKSEKTWNNDKIERKKNGRYNWFFDFIFKDLVNNQKISATFHKMENFTDPNKLIFSKCNNKNKKTPAVIFLMY